MHIVQASNPCLHIKLVTYIRPYTRKGRVAMRLELVTWGWCKGQVLEAPHWCCYSAGLKRRACQVVWEKRRLSELLDCLISTESLNSLVCILLQALHQTWMVTTCSTRKWITIAVNFWDQNDNILHQFLFIWLFYLVC